MPVSFVVNGEERVSRAPPLTPLLEVLRDEFALTAAKRVCGEGFCGACTVLLDGAPAVACLVPLGAVEGRAVRTVEGLAPSPTALSPLQQALHLHDVVQCGMCFPGLLMSLTAFLERHARPSRDDIRAALAGNICRCTGYDRIVDAVHALTAAPAEAAR